MQYITFAMRWPKNYIFFFLLTAQSLSKYVHHARLHAHRALTYGVVQGLSCLFVPHQRGLPLIGHAHRCEKAATYRKRQRGTLFLSLLRSKGQRVISVLTEITHSRQRTCLAPLMLATLMLRWRSFSHVLSTHSYTDWMISLGSSSTHLTETKMMSMSVDVAETEILSSGRGSLVRLK